MNRYESLLDSADKLGITIHEKYSFNSPRIKGLYCDNHVALSNRLNSNAERISILAEELGHFYTTSGIILDLNDSNNQKQECKARMWAYSNILVLEDFIKAYKHGCQNRFELAEYLEVSEEFLDNVIVTMKKKHGSYKKIDNYIIVFEPFGIIELMNQF